MTDEPAEQEPQFPARAAEAEQEPAVNEPLLPPPGPVRRLMAEHLRERHGVQWFRLGRHVYLGGGTRRRSQRLTWLPAQSSFLCSDCPGEIFWSGDWTDEMRHSAELWEPGLQQRLAGISDPEERELVMELHLDGIFARAELEQAAALAYRETVARSRPSVQVRRGQLQERMLDFYAELGTKVAVIEAAYELQFREPTLWQQLVGRPLSKAAIESYWDQIPNTKKLQAKRRYQRRRDK